VLKCNIMEDINKSGTGGEILDWIANNCSKIVILIVLYVAFEAVAVLFVAYIVQLVGCRGIARHLYEPIIKMVGLMQKNWVVLLIPAVILFYRTLNNLISRIKSVGKGGVDFEKEEGRSGPIKKVNRQPPKNET
jgi:hypothetical protein